MKARAFEQPTLNAPRLMGAVVIENQMNIKLRRHLCLDTIKELAKLLRAMTAMQLSDDLASFGIQGSKKRSSAIARVIMTMAFRLPRTHWQNWLCAIQSLNLRLLIDT